MLCTSTHAMSEQATSDLLTRLHADRHNVAHDGSIAPLLGALQVASGFWPGMGTEIVFELYKDRSGAFFVRVLLSGQPMQTSTPLGTLNAVPWADFEKYIVGLVGSPSGLSGYCKGK